MNSHDWVGKKIKPLWMIGAVLFSIFGLKAPRVFALPVAAATPIPPRTVIISEIAWAGTAASSYDEWIELYNPSSQPIDLTGWHLTAADGSPDIALQGTIPAQGFFLLERTDDTTVSDIPADLIYTGSLSNTGESLTLYGPSNEVVDTANANGGPWPAGDAAIYASMERIGLTADSDAAWGTNNGALTHGLDANGNPLRGTAKFTNSVNAATPTPTPAPSPSPSPTPTPIPTATIAPQAVLISEIAWAGTAASSYDEWIELYNPSSQPIDLTGWHLTAADGSPDIALQGTIPAQGFFLLERTDDTTVSDIPADLIYTGSLSNTGESLTLYGPSNEVVDTANANGGPWPAGDAAIYASMERIGLAADSDAAWGTNNGALTHGLDANGNPLRGTAKFTNSVNAATPTPTPTPTAAPQANPAPTPTLKPLKSRVLIGEFLPHPRYDWNQDGAANTGDEFIEIVNLGPEPVNLDNWLLDDGEGGSQPFEIPETGLMPGHVVVFFAKQTDIRLNDSGDTIRLLRPNGELVDEVHYSHAFAWNLSWCRPEGGWGALTYPCWPTPGRAHNVLYGTPQSPSSASSPTPSPAPTATLTPPRTTAPSQAAFLGCFWSFVLKTGVCIR